MNSFKSNPYLKLIFAMLIVGSFIVVNKVLSSTFPIFLASGLRLMIGAIILNLLLFAKEKRYPRLSKRDFLIVFTQSFVGVFLFSFFLLYGLKFTSAVESGIITSVTPAIIGLMSIVIFKEKLNTYQVMGIIAALIGTIIINVVGVLSNSNWNASLWGNILVFCAVIGEAIFITFAKLLARNLSPLASATLTCTIGFLLFLPISLYQTIQFNFAEVTLTTWALILYTGTFVTVIAVILLNQAMSQLSTGTSAVFSSVMPMSAVILSFLVLKEPIHWYHLIGFAFIIAGITFISKQKKKTLSIELKEQDISA